MFLLGLLDSRLKATLFGTYILLWSLQGILVHRANRDSPLPFQPAAVIAIQDFFKLVVSLSLSATSSGRASDRSQYISLFAWYLLPALLYAVYNNLTFFALTIFDPTTYFVLMQFRIVFTGFFSVLLLGKQITSVQWTALLVIMVGAMVKELPRAVFSSSFSGYGIVGVQICLSVVAGLVNEKILKQIESPVAVQNVFMYFNSLALHSFYGLSVFGTKFPSEILNVLNNTYLVPVIINAGLIGILTSYFLKHLSSVHKSIASAIELWLTAVLSSLVFGYPIDPSSISGIMIVTIGVCVFSVYAEPERTGRDRHVKHVTASGASFSLFHLKSS